VPTELWVSGDDGLTQRFADAIRHAVSKSGDLILAAAGEGQLIMTIPTHVRWQNAGDKVRFQRVVVFADRSAKQIGISTGDCWDGALDECASAVVSDARNAWAEK